MKLFFGAFLVGFFTYFTFRIGQAMWRASMEQQAQQWPY
jgi:hypothetical protein